MHQTIFGQTEGYDGGEYGKAGENKRENDVKAYIKTGMLHGVLTDKIVQIMLIMGL
jgi:hypothetical protein